MKLREAAYEGNLGAIEMMKFYQKASPTDIKRMEQFLRKGAWQKAWDLLKKVTGVLLRDPKWRS